MTLREIVKNDLILNMIPENRKKHFMAGQKLDCLAQHLEKADVWTSVSQVISLGKWSKLTANQI